MERESEFGLQHSLAPVLALERDLVEREHRDLDERALQELAHLRIAAGERYRHLVALEGPACALRLVACRLQLDAGGAADGVELCQPVGGRLGLRQVLVHRPQLVRGAAGACRRTAHGLGTRGEPPVLLLQRLEHKGHEERRADEERNRCQAHGAELVAQAKELFRNHRFTSFQAAEMENETGCCGSFCRTSWRTSWTCDSASFWLSVST